MATYALTKAGVRVLLLEAGRHYDPPTETPMFTPAREAPLRGASTPDKPFGYFDATVNGGWEVPGEPYTVAEGSKFQWWRARMLGGRTNHWGRFSTAGRLASMPPVASEGARSVRTSNRPRCLCLCRVPRASSRSAPMRWCTTLRSTNPARRAVFDTSIPRRAPIARRAPAPSCWRRVLAARLPECHDPADLQPLRQWIEARAARTLRTRRRGGRLRFGNFAREWSRHTGSLIRPLGRPLTSSQTSPVTEGSMPAIRTVAVVCRLMRLWLAINRNAEEAKRGGSRRAQGRARSIGCSAAPDFVRETGTGT